MSKKIDEKEVYRLWWEYLKRSEGFKISYDWWIKYEVDRETEMPEILESCDIQTRGEILLTCHTFMGLHTKSFDDWWEIQKPGLEYQREWWDSVAIRNYIGVFESDFNMCIENFKDKEGREPTLDEFKNSYIRFLMDRPFHLILAVNLATNKIDTLRKAFDRLTREMKKDPTIKAWEKQFRLPHSEIKRVRYDELKRYLAVYDLKKDGMKYQDIIKKLGTKSQKEHYYDLDILRQFRRDFQHATQIIKNAVLGKFPLMTELPLSKYPFSDLT